MYDADYLKETLRITFKDDDSLNIPKGITRHHSNQGWVTRDTAKFHKFFTDNVFGSINESLREAILYRHEVLSSFPIEKTTKFHAKTLDSNPENRISRHKEKGRKQPYIYWKAKWYDDDFNLKTKNFSVLKYGEGEAKSLALQETIKNHNKDEKPPVDLTIPDPYEEQKFRKELKSELEFWSEYYQETNNRSNSSGGKKISEIIVEDPFAFEGGKKLVIHRKIERDPKFRLKKIKTFLDQHGKLFCEVCSFSFKDTFPFLEKDIIEVHHKIPLSELTKETKIHLSDLILICSNCHFAIHQGDAIENLKLAEKQFETSKH